jgi:parallel beta-helix repeat protein
MRPYYFIIIVSITLLFFLGCTEQSRNTSDLAIKIIGKESYATIQNAINHASDGDTILISNGIYYEHILVNKSIQLIGEHKDYTIINANNTSSVCIITTDNVQLTNLSFRNSGSGTNDAGVNIQANNSRIEKCGFDHNYNGVSISIAKNTQNNIINNNTFYHNYHGIHIKESTQNKITHNTILNNSGYGLFLDFYANNNQINNNTIKTNHIGIRVKTSILNVITSNWLIQNTGEGLHLCCSSHKNTIYKNYFINNSVNALDSYSNQWNYRNIGNYWSDYQIQNPSAIDENQDGYWDTPYLIENKENTDSYPLINYPEIY